MSDNEGFMLAVEELRKIAREEIPPIVKEVLQAALGDIPSRGEVEGMIKSATDAQAERYYASHKSIDEHLRASEKAFRDGLTEIKTVNGELRGTNEIVRTTNEQIKTLQEKYGTLDSRLTTVTNANIELRRDIFGDPLTPDVPSMISEQRRRDQERIEQRRLDHTEVMNRLDSLKNQGEKYQERVDVRLKPMELYIQRREQIEGWIYNVLSWLSKHPRVTWALVLFIAARLGIQIGAEFVTWIQTVVK
jgi:hypothetical protein